MKKTSLALGLILIGCGDQSGDPYGSGSQLDEINSRIDSLAVVAENLNVIVMSDFASCNETGDTSDPLVNKICQIAQASTVEVQSELQNQLGLFVNELEREIAAVETDLLAANANLDLINANLANMQVEVDALDVRMTSAEAAILVLQNLTASINGTLQGTMRAVLIGEENVLAGPVYESILIRTDRTKVNGYVEAYGAYQSFGSNPLRASNGSPNVTVTLTAHGFSPGDRVEMSGLTAGRGFLTADLIGIFTVNTAPTANTFTITLRRNATSNGTLGGNTGVIREFNGRGMSGLWTSGQVSDSAVRVTNAGSAAYNFIIRRRASDVTNATAEICYSKNSATASFVVINAAPEGGDSSIACH